MGCFSDSISIVFVLMVSCDCNKKNSLLTSLSFIPRNENDYEEKTQKIFATIHVAKSLSQYLTLSLSHFQLTIEYPFNC